MCVYGAAEFRAEMINNDFQFRMAVSCHHRIEPKRKEKFTIHTHNNKLNGRADLFAGLYMLIANYMLFSERVAAIVIAYGPKQWLKGFSHPYRCFFLENLI